MDALNLILTRAFDLCLAPFSGMAAMWGVAVVSVVSGIVLLLIFGKTSNQRKIRQLKDKMKGHMLEMWIFRDSAAVVLKAQGRVFWNLARYTACFLPSFVIVLVPVLLIMIQLQARYGYAPLRPGESAFLSLLYTKPVSADAMSVDLTAPDGVTVETPALRIPESREVDFRIRADKAGQHRIVATVGGERFAKIVCVGNADRAMSPVRSSRMLARLLYPAEPGLPSGSLESITVRYRAARMTLWGLSFHWVWPFLILSLAAGFALKGVFRVEL